MDLLVQDGNDVVDGTIRVCCLPSLERVGKGTSNGGQRDKYAEGKHSVTLDGGSQRRNSRRKAKAVRLKDVLRGLRKFADMSHLFKNGVKKQHRLLAGARRFPKPNVAERSTYPITPHAIDKRVRRYQCRGTFPNQV